MRVSARAATLGVLAAGALACGRQQAAEVPAPSTPAMAPPTALRPEPTVPAYTGPRAGDLALQSSPLLARMNSSQAVRLADSLLRLMTPAEKLGQLTQTPAAWLQTGPAVPSGGEEQVRRGEVGSFLSFYGAQATRDVQRIAVEQSRLRIPLIFAYDVIHGWRTTFPEGLAQAAMFDSAMVAQGARIAAVEAAAAGLHWTFAPMVDVTRDPRWGRMAEGSGEDPYLTSVLSAAGVVGFQGGSVEEGTALAATVKHYAAYGAPEGGRDYDVVEVGERTLWETYMPPYEAGVRAGALTVMASFNEINGTPAHASDWLLDDVLRERWGFKGMIVSDWTGVAELQAHGVGPTRLEAARRAITAGVDMEMSSTFYRDTLQAAVAGGTMPQAVIDTAVHRVLRLKYAMGLFDDPYRYSNVERERTAMLKPEYRAAAREASRRAIVLLKNDASTLPLDPRRARTVALIGPLADDAKAMLGPWWGQGKPEDAVTVLAGLKAALPNARILRATGVPLDTVRRESPRWPDSVSRAVALVRQADVVILALGEHPDQSGEAASRSYVELPGAQPALVRAVAREARLRRKPLVLVTHSGRALALGDIADSVPAIVQGWFLGVEHGNAIADVLFGKANPSGRLPVTFPRTSGQIPIHYDRRSTGRPAGEGEYTSKYLDVPWTPLYPFGHGLSYTTYTYSAPRLSATTARTGATITVEATITNTGRVAGEEVAQLYLRDDAASVTRPVRMLKGFQRVALQPGESKSVRFTVGPEAMSLYDATMRQVVEPGAFSVWVGGSSAVAEGAGTKFTLTGDTLVVAPAPPRIR